jgi:hypothetical protein
MKDNGQMLKYVELKSGFSNNGPAWIARVTVSKSGRTVYFNGRALKRTGKSGRLGNHQDAENGDEYWVSGVKKNGRDRHWAGSGRVSIEASAVPEYLALVGHADLDATRLEVVADLSRTEATRFVALENEKLA